MDKLQRIFAAIDFSSGSDEALRQAHERAVFTRAKLAVCHIVPNELRSHLLFPHISRIASLNDPFELERVADTDFSDPALPALRAAAVEARRTKGDLTIVHSLDLVWPAAGVASMALGGSPFNISDEQVRTLEDLARQRLDDALKQLHIQGQ